MEGSLEQRDEERLRRREELPTVEAESDLENRKRGGRA
jgi:hypothetical protein